MVKVIRDGQVRDVPDSLYAYMLGLGFSPYLNSTPSIPSGSTEPDQGAVPRYDQNSDSYLPGSLLALVADIVATSGFTNAVRALVPTSLPEILVSPSGDAAGAADKTAFQAAVDVLAAAGGGLVRTVRGASYFFNGFVVNKSYVTIDTRNSTCTLVAGVNDNLFKNQGSISVYTGTDAAGTVGSNVITTSAALSAVVGQVATITNMGAADQVPLVGLVAAVTSTTITLVDPVDCVGIPDSGLAARKPMNVRQTKTTETIKLFNRDVEVGFQLGRVVRAAGNDTGPTGYRDRTIHLRWIDRLTFTLERAESSDGKAFISTAGLTRVRGYVKSMDVAKGGFLVGGPARDWKLDYVAGVTRDDVLALLGSDYAPYADHSGDIIDFQVGSVSGTAYTGNLFKVIAGGGNLTNGNRCDQIQVSNQIAGQADVCAAWVGDDPGGPGCVGGSYGTIDLGTVAGQPVGTRPVVGLYLPNADHIKMNLAYKGSSSSSFGAIVRIGSLSGATPPATEIKKLTIEGVADASAHSAFCHMLTTTYDLSTIGQLSTSLDYVPPAAGGAFVNFGAASRIRNFTARGGSIRGSSTGYGCLLNFAANGIIDQGTFLGLAIDGSGAAGSGVGFAVTNNIATVVATIRRLAFIGGYANGIQNLVSQTGNVAVTPMTVVLAGGFYLYGLGRVCSFKAPSPSSSAPMNTVVLDGCVFDTIANEAFWADYAGILMMGSGYTSVGSFTLLKRNQGSEIFRINSTAFGDDLNKLSRSFAGDTVRDTANRTVGSAAGQLVTSSGSGTSGSWRNLSDATKTY